MNKLIAFKSEVDKSGTCYSLTNGRWEKQSLSVPEEMPLTIVVNNCELVTILCSPHDLDFLVIGYLFSEGIVRNCSEISLIKVSLDNRLVDVQLNRELDFTPQKKILTSGFGGGIGLGRDNAKMKLKSKMKISPAAISELIQLMIDHAACYHLTGGVHATVLCDHAQILVMGEDIGRHNTLDKVIGKCLKNNIHTKDKILMTTGRIASEILKKAVTLEIPVIASLSSPTSEAVSLAELLGVTLIGYARGKNMIVYSNEDRLAIAAEEKRRLAYK